MTFGIYYAENSHESEAFNGEYQAMDWDREGCELTLHGEYDSLEAAMEAADTNGVGVYMVSGDTDGHYTGAIRVVAGASPEFRSL